MALCRIRCMERNKAPWLLTAGYARLSLLLCVLIGLFSSLTAANTKANTTANMTTIVHSGPIVSQISQVAGEPLTGIKGILHSQSGFIWLASSDGLLRFDGQSIKRFENQTNNANSLPANDVRAMVEDEQGIIWLITRGGGLSRFEPKTEQFINFQTNDQPTSIDSLQLNSIALGQNNQLWIASDKGINRFDRQTYTNTRLNSQMQPRGANEDENVQLIYADNSADSSAGNNADKNERIWFAVRRKGLFLHIPQGNQTLHFAAKSDDSSSLDSAVISDIYQAPNGDIWIGTALSVSRFNSQTLTFSRFAIPLKARNKVNHASVTSMAADKWGNLWVGTFYNGVSVLYQGGEHFVDIEGNLAIDDSLMAMQINDVMQDLQGGLWLVTARDGLIKVSNEHSLFDHHSLIGGQAEALRDEMPYWQSGLVMSANGEVLLLQQGQLWLYDSARHQFKLFKHADKIVDIVVSRQHGVLVAMQSGGIKQVNVASKSLVDVFAGIEMPVAKFVIDADDQYLWFYPQSSGGLYRYELANHGLEAYFVDGSEMGRVTAIAVSSNQLYVAFDQRTLHAYDYDQQRFRPLPKLDAEVFQIVLQDDGVWLATANGILHNSDESRPWSSFSLNREALKDKPIPAAIYAIHPVEAEHWWASTSEGILRIHRQSGQVMVLDKEKGLRLSEFSTKVPLTMLSGNVLMAGFSDDLAAVVRFNPQRLTQTLDGEGSNQEVLFTELKLFNQTVALKFTDVNSPLSTTINQTEHLQLTHQQNWFTLLFTSQLFTNQVSQQDGDIRYAYMLEGLSDQWIETNAGQAKFTSVAAGQYLFKVKVSSGGQWSEQVRVLPITVTPAWWESSWAYTVYVLLVIGFVLTINGLRTRQLKQRAAVLEQKVAVRTKELKQRADTISLLLSEKEGLLGDKERLLEDKDRLIANISHEFRTPLTLILGPLGEQIGLVKDAKTTAQLGLAEANANRLLYMVDQLLDLARLKNPNVEQMKGHDLAATLQFLVGSFEPLAKARRMSLTIKDNHQQPIWVMAQADALEKIITNLLSNAIKYSADGGVIEVSMQLLTSDGLAADGLSGKKVAFSVKDNGFGISEADLALVFERFGRIKNDGDYIPGSGIGLALVKELLVIHQGDISVQSQLGKGSCFTVTLPTLDGKEPDEKESLNDKSVNEQVVADAMARMTPRKLALQDTLQQGEQISDTLSNILVIEDNADMRQYIIDSLGGRFHCLAAPDGKAGLDLAVQHLPDLVISDVMMPNMDGFEVTQRLKSDDKTNHIPVILLTARGDRESRIKGWSQKADEYLEKPFNTEELLMRIDNLLAIRQLLRKRFGHAFISPLPDSLPSLTPSLSSCDNTAVPTVLVEENKQESSELSREDGANLNPAHQIFLDQTNKVLDQYYQDSDFDVAKFAVQMALSHRQLGRKMKAILDMTPAEALRNYRLNQAAKLLKQGGSASVVAHQVGFTTHSYFSQCFKARFNCLPSQFCHKV